MGLKHLLEAVAKGIKDAREHTQNDQLRGVELTALYVAAALRNSSVGFREDLFLNNCGMTDVRKDLHDELLKLYAQRPVESPKKKGGD